MNEHMKLMRKASAKVEADCVREGFYAASNGAPVTDCPYIEASRAGEAWLKGYSRGRPHARQPEFD